MSGASVPPAYLTAPPTSLPACLSPADAARAAVKVSPPARTKSRSRTPKTVTKRSHDAKQTPEVTRDDGYGSTAARTVAHAEPPKRVHANGKTGNRETADGAESTRKRRAEVSPDSSARKRRMRNDNTTAPSVRSAAGNASPRLNGSEARTEKRAEREKPETEKECETSPDASGSRPDRKSRSANSGHNATVAAVTSSRAGYKSPPATGQYILSVCCLVSVFFSPSSSLSHCFRITRTFFVLVFHSLSYFHCCLFVTILSSPSSLHHILLSVVFP